MNTLLIFYFPGQLGFLSEQQEIINYLQSSGTWAKLADNLWLIKTTRGTVNVRDDLRAIFSRSIRSQGKVLVVNVTKTTWASYNFTPEVTEWMKNNI